LESGKMAITTYKQALDFVNSPQGQAIPGIWDAKARLLESNSISSLKRYRAEDIANIAKAAKDPLKWQLDRSVSAVANYARAVAGGFDKNFDASVKKNIIKEYEKLPSYLVSNKLNVSDIQRIWRQAEQSLLRNQQMQSKKSTFDYVFDIADSLIVGSLTGGLGLSPLNAAALSSAIAIANGADVKQALQAGLAGLGASQVGEYLQTVNSIAGNQVVNSAVTNASRQAAAAAIMGQDIKTAALAGLAGGAVGGSLLRSTDNAAISRAAGEYTQAMASGMSPAAAMVQALSGFAEEEMVDAKTKIEQESAMQQAATRAPTVTPEDQIVEAFSQPRSPGVGTQIGQPTAELSGGIQFGSKDGAVGTDIVPDDRLPSTPAKPVAIDVNTLPEVVVTPEPEGATEQPKRYDVRTGKLITTRIPTTTTTQNQPTPPPEKLTGAELIEQAQSPQDTSTLPEVTVEAEAGEEGKEPVTTRLPTAKGEGEGEATVSEVAPEEVTDDEILAAIDEARDPLILSLLGGRTGRTPPPPSSVSSRAVGTSPTAAIVGQKEPVFGGEEDTQQDVWNTRSLRLRKALG
jgi:hypothetical protein